MKYKVGDKVKVRSDLKAYEIYGSNMLTKSMEKFVGKTVTISDVGITSYAIEEMGVAYWTEEMLEPVEEMSAEEAIRLQGEICMSLMCRECPIDKLREDSHLECAEFRAKHPEEIVKILKQWKADHEKKDVEVEFVWYAVIKDEKGSIVHEERIESPLGSNKEYLENNKEILAKYCSEHNGKFYGLTERRCVVKE